jgi:hypothetical protein
MKKDTEREREEGEGGERDGKEGGRERRRSFVSEIGQLRRSFLVAIFSLSKLRILLHCVPEMPTFRDGFLNCTMSNVLF